MTLRARLTMFFAGIVVVPLLAAAVVLQQLVSREIQKRSETRLQVGSRATAELWRGHLDVARREVRHVARGIVESIDRDEIDEGLDRARQRGELDFLIVTADGAVLAASTGPASFLQDLDTPSGEELVAEEGSAQLLRSRVEVLAGKRTVTVTGGFYADQSFVRDLAGATGLDVAVTSGGRVIASTLSPAPRIPTGAVGLVQIGDGMDALVSEVQGEDGGIAVVAQPEGAAGFRTSIWVIVVAIGLLVATALGYALARLLARPLQRLAEGAMAVASGDFDTHVDAEGQGDVAQLAEAFNSMTENLRGYVGELRKSRDELRRGLDRLGETLSSTHDLEGMFAVILDTAAVTLGAKAGAVYLLSPSGRNVRLEVARGYEAPERAALRIGEGIAGRSAAGISVLLPSERDPVSPSRPVEPAAPTAIAVPLIRGDRTMGVLALYGRSIPEPFVQDDVATLGSFAAQASVAVENVLLHKEAERLSITDGLTGVWNRRYLQLTLTKEIERAQRFGRPLSVLMMDIDHFKLVNDAHGHHVGDEVLVELTRRTMSTIRGQIDALARYGGEEFVVVLPETPTDGAKVVADKILAVIRHRPFVEDEQGGVPLTVSIGVAAFPEDAATADELVRAADLAMYRAKEAGRDRVETAESH
ncbi:MAG TPA: diguanylate cyclase [Actinomycetota bacterium]|nr:diguanylate cyclase [Actinomycetota bacterium]